MTASVYPRALPRPPSKPRSRSALVPSGPRSRHHHYPQRTTTRPAHRRSRRARRLLLRPRRRPRVRLCIGVPTRRTARGHVRSFGRSGRFLSCPRLSDLGPLASGPGAAKVPKAARPASLATWAGPHEQEQSCRGDSDGFVSLGPVLNGGWTSLVPRGPVPRDRRACAPHARAGGSGCRAERGLDH